MPGGETDDAEARLRELRSAYDRLRRRLDDTSASERESTRAAAASAQALTKGIRRCLDTVAQNETRERRMIEEWEGDVRVGWGDSSTSRARQAAVPPRSGSNVSPQPTLRTFTGSASSDASVEVHSEADTDFEDALQPGRDSATGARQDSGSVSPGVKASASNPNVLGEPVGGQSNRQWYLCEAVRRTLLLHAGLAMARADPDEDDSPAPRGPAAPAGADGAEDDSDEAELRRDDWRSGSITDAAVAGLQRHETPKKPAKKTGAFSAFKASLSAKRQARKSGAGALQEPKYHCHLDHGSVAAEVGTDRAGRLRSLRHDAITAPLRERFGVADTENDDGDSSSSRGGAGGSDRSLGFNSFERIYGRTAANATASAGTTDDALFQGGKRAPRVDEIVFTFHAEVHLTQVRRGLGITLDDIRASCGSRCASWRVGSSAGKSDSMFLYFGHHVAKSINESEFKFLTTEYLPAFAAYTDRAPYTLLPHFSFLFSVTWLASRRTMRFVVMNNVFRTQHFIQRMYDLKGSTVGRDGVDAKSGEATVRTGFGAVLLKDNDTPNRLMVVGPMRRAMLVAQIQSDTSFLQRLNVVDYSLLVGQRSRSISTADVAAATVTPPANAFLGPGGHHRRSQSHGDPSTMLHGSEGSPLTVGTPGGHKRSASALAGHGPHGNGGAGPAFNPAAPDQLDGRCFRSSDGGLVSLPVHESANGSEAREDTFYIGIIDVLQQYSGVKKIENMAKSIFYDGSKISIVPPPEFAQRLCMLVERVTV